MLKRTPLKRKTPLKRTPNTSLKRTRELDKPKRIAYLTRLKPSIRADLAKTKAIEITFVSQLKRKRRLNPVSLKRVLQMQAETPERIALCNRAGGVPIMGKQTYYIKGKSYEVDTIQCFGGICEICHERKHLLEPHEYPFRSHGGKVSLKQSKMVCRECHDKEQNNNPMWSKSTAVVSSAIMCLGAMIG